MSSHPDPQTANGATSGVFQYMDDSVAPSLYRNGSVFTNRALDGSDTTFVGANYAGRNMVVHNARLLRNGSQPTLFRNGFEICEAPLDDSRLDFLDHTAVVERYYRQCAELVAEATGARAFAFDHNIRSAAGQNARTQIVGGQSVQGPAFVVHSDYTLTSAPQRLRDLACPPKRNDTLASILEPGMSLVDEGQANHALNGGRFAIMNVWRSIAEAPVERNPFALCDSQTIMPDDLVVFEIRYQDRIGENYFAKHAPAHRWYYYPHMTRDEVILLKQWDSDGVLARTGGLKADSVEHDRPCTFSFHSAFDDPDTGPEAPDRWSIEVRCMVLYD